MKVICPIRNDDQGAGYFGAPRGDKTHRGIDYQAPVGATVCAVEEGEVTKIGYPYEGNFELRYVEITDTDGSRGRYFYVDPEVRLHQWIERGQAIGVVQSLQDRFPGMDEHVHFELIVNGEYVDPAGYAGA